MDEGGISTPEITTDEINQSKNTHEEEKVEGYVVLRAAELLIAALSSEEMNIHSFQTVRFEGSDAAGRRNHTRILSNYCVEVYLL